MLESNRLTTQRVDDVEAVERKPWGTPQFGNGGNLMLKIGGTTLRIPMDQPKVVGRAAPDMPTKPDVDLGPYNALAQGVSRLHARLSVSEGKLYIEDLDSVNGTYVNGTRLTKNTRMMLQDGMEIHLAKLMIQCFF